MAHPRSLCCTADSRRKQKNYINLILVLSYSDYVKSYEFDAYDTKFSSDNKAYNKKFRASGCSQQ